MKEKSKAPATNPAKGPSTMARNTLLLRISQFIIPEPPAAIPAPRSPPTNEWLTLIGIPNKVQINTQTTAPNTPTAIMTSVISTGKIIPPRVSATFVETQAPARLKTLAKINAFTGVSAFVAVTVAIAFARSFAPFKKSKTNAKNIIRITNHKASIPLNPAL